MIKLLDTWKRHVQIEWKTPEYELYRRMTRKDEYWWLLFNRFTAA